MRNALLVCAICTQFLHAQTTCTAWQWTDSDSANKTISEIDSLNAQGKTIRATMTNCRMQEYSVPDQVNSSVYRDMFLISWTGSTPDGDSMRNTYEYNDAGKCIHENQYRFNHVEAAQGSSGMFTFKDANHDTTEGKWIELTTGTYTYNKSGQKVLFVSHALDGKEANKEIWTYNKKGQLISHESYYLEVLYKKEEYSYFKGGYSIKMVLIEDDKPRNEISRDSVMYRPARISTYKQDKNGRITEIRISDDDTRKQTSRYVITYNSAGEQVRDEYYDDADKLLITHEYVYK